MLLFGDRSRSSYHVTCIWGDWGGVEGIWSWDYDIGWLLLQKKLFAKRLILPAFFHLSKKNCITLPGLICCLNGKFSLQRSTGFCLKKVVHPLRCWHPSCHGRHLLVVSGKPGDNEHWGRVFLVIPSELIPLSRNADQDYHMIGRGSWKKPSLTTVSENGITPKACTFYSWGSVLMGSRSLPWLWSACSLVQAPGDLGKNTVKNRFDEVRSHLFGWDGVSWILNGPQLLWCFHRFFWFHISNGWARWVRVRRFSMRCERIAGMFWRAKKWWNSLSD